MPGTKINGLFGFNRLSSVSLFDIYIENTQVRKIFLPVCCIIITLMPLSKTYYISQEEEEDNYITREFQGCYRFSKLTAKSMREIADNFLHSSRGLSIHCTSHGHYLRRTESGADSHCTPSNEPHGSTTRGPTDI
jgi:hypothetical protein